jgi:TolA-binding protein
VKTKFAAERLHHLYDDLKQIGMLLDSIHTEALDPHIVSKQAVKAERLRLAVIDQLKRGIEPLLERAAPPLEKRVGALEEQVQALQGQLQRLITEYTTIETTEQIKERRGA